MKRQLFIRFYSISGDFIHPVSTVLIILLNDSILICKEYYTLYLVEHHDPDMKRSPLAKVVLKTKELDFGAPKELLALAMDPPDLINIKL